MKKRLPVIPIALTALALCSVLGAVAQNAQTSKPAMPSGEHKAAVKRGSLSLEEYLIRSKVITHNAERKALWTALWKVWPGTFHASKADLAAINGASIALYAENASATELCFYKSGRVYTFDGHEGQISPVVMAKVLPPINAITFQDSKGPEGPSFILWCSGQPEASIGALRE